MTEPHKLEVDIEEIIQKANTRMKEWEKEMDKTTKKVIKEAMKEIFPSACRVGCLFVGFVFGILTVGVLMVKWCQVLWNLLAF